MGPCIPCCAHFLQELLQGDFLLVREVANKFAVALLTSLFLRRIKRLSLSGGGRHSMQFAGNIPAGSASRHTPSSHAQPSIDNTRTCKAETTWLWRGQSRQAQQHRQHCSCLPAVNNGPARLAAGSRNAHKARGEQLQCRSQHHSAWT